MNSINGSPQCGTTKAEAGTDEAGPEEEQGNQQQLNWAQI
jgi:hypothetical protein